MIIEDFTIFDHIPDDNNGIYLKLDRLDKIYPIDNTYESCVSIKNELDKYGIKSIIGQNMESDKWSIAIIDAPGTYYVRRFV